MNTSALHSSDPLLEVGRDLTQELEQPFFFVCGFELQLCDFSLLLCDTFLGTNAQALFLLQKEHLPLQRQSVVPFE